MNTQQQYIDELILHLMDGDTPVKLENALRALLTDSEMDEISKRLQIFKLLESGMPQRQIAEKLGVGIATVTRGSNALKRQKLTSGTAE